MARKNIPRLKDLAARVGCSPRSHTGWLNGAHQPSAYYLGQLSRVLDTDVRRLISAEDPHPAVLSRRTFVAGTTALIGTTFLPFTLPLARPVSSGVPQAIISSLAAITQQYRTMQRNGLAGIEEGLRGHVATIQGALEATSDSRRRPLTWKRRSGAFGGVGVQALTVTLSAGNRALPPFGRLLVPTWDTWPSPTDPYRCASTGCSTSWRPGGAYCFLIWRRGAALAGVAALRSLAPLEPRARRRRELDHQTSTS